jgi:hypothetical protein
MARDIPHSKDDLALGHHIAHYTFFPTMLTMLGVALSAPPAWYLGYIPFGLAIAIPWFGLLSIVAWIALVGDYVMPAETYRKLKRGEFDR